MMGNNRHSAYETRDSCFPSPCMLGRNDPSDNLTQSQVMNRLTIISAVFLLMTFLTGYLGMNMQWMVDHIKSLEVYLFLGVASFVAMLATTLLLFKSRGWL
jgi:Mg2+ and Co2+ transporter CorA